jgi:hypothetical protein
MRMFMGVLFTVFMSVWSPYTDDGFNPFFLGLDDSDLKITDCSDGGC